MKLIVFGATGLLAMEDFAIAMLDEAEHPKHSRERFIAAH